MTSLIQETNTIQSPLLIDFSPVQIKICNLTKNTKDLYFEALFSIYKCPICSAKLKMIQHSQCSCNNGHIFDPTITFQKSNCCNARLTLKTYHYRCTSCKKIVPSRFLFGEQLYNRKYFAEMMQKARQRSRRKKEQLIRSLALSHSRDLDLLEEPCLDSISGLMDDLNNFVGEGSFNEENYRLEHDKEFDFNKYRSHILDSLCYGSRLFSGIARLSSNERSDKIWRFITIIFMQHEREVEVSQCANDLVIERLYV